MTPSATRALLRIFERSTVLTDVLQALHDARVLVAPLTRPRGVTVVFTGCDALPPATVDEQRLGRLLYKLFTAAIRSTPVNGTVRVAGEVVRGEGSRGRPRIQIAITDPGPAATLGDLERLVRSFNPVEILGAEHGSGGVTLTAASGLLDPDPAIVSLRLASDQQRTLLLTLPVVGNNDMGDATHGTSGQPTYRSGVHPGALG